MSDPLESLRLLQLAIARLGDELGLDVAKISLQPSQIDPDTGEQTPDRIGLAFTLRKDALLSLSEKEQLKFDEIFNEIIAGPSESDPQPKLNIDLSDWFKE